MSSNRFSFTDIGCGNGWVTRTVAQSDECVTCRGVDGAEDMIANAKSRDESGKIEYTQADVSSVVPDHRSDVLFSMEVFYYLSEQQVPKFLQSLANDWLEPPREDGKGGILVFGIDHFKENLSCHNWSAINDTPMILQSEQWWREQVESAGFCVIKQWRAAKREGMESGTLAFLAQKK